MISSLHGSYFPLPVTFIILENTYNQYSYNKFIRHMDYIYNKLNKIIYKLYFPFSYPPIRVFILLFLHERKKKIIPLIGVTV